MVNLITSHAAVVLPTTLVLLLIAPHDSLSYTAVTLAASAMAALEPSISSYFADLRTENEMGDVDVRVWMHKGDEKLHGCGFYFQATSASNLTAFTFFPDKTVHQCGNDRYKLRFTAQGGVYGKIVQIGYNPVQWIELHADGWHDTFVNVLCLGWRGIGASTDIRGFCLNNKFLKACQHLGYYRWPRLNLQWNDIKFTRTNRASHKIVFRDVQNLTIGYQRFRANVTDVGALRTVCDRIDLVKGTATSDHWNCPAEKTETEVAWGGMHAGWLGQYTSRDVNPYGCNPNSYSI